ncbi:unnamed protein product [Rotaria magnacalcarata]|uniref:Uncharacterized protein n=1 Tax=Rotaria magnacalcarata TaxID=392030 RepID=A0A816Z8C4_9BILA|nr:unnamed protein product [Rotaria magnacalcarata]
MVVINDDANSDSYEFMDIQVKTDDSSCLTTVENPTLITTTNHQVVKLQLNATSSSHTKCCVCRENLRDHAVKITSRDRDFIFFSRNIWIPEGARYCSGHLINNLLSKEAVDQIKPFSIRYQELSSSDVQLLLSKAQTLFENGKKRFSLDDPRDLNDDEYCLLTSFGHVTREDVIGGHTTAITQELMCGGDSTDIPIIIIDGAHLYIQKSRNNEFQRKTFNLYKKGSLLKSMMIVTTTDYIVACIEPFMSDFNNNDGAIMKDIYLLNNDHILSWLFFALFA